MAGGRLRLWVGLLAGLILAVGACAPITPSPGPAPGKPVTVGQETGALLSLGAQRLSQGRREEAGDAFRAALRLAPDVKRRAQAMLGLARVQEARGDREAALQWTQRMLAQAWDSSLAMEAELLAARLEMDLGRGRQAAGRLQRVLARPPGPLDRAQRRRVQDLLVRALDASGQYGAAARALVRQAQEGDAAQARESAPALALAAGKAPSREIRPLLPMASWPQTRTALLIGLTRALLREGRLDQAESLLGQIRTSPAAESWRAVIRQLDAQVSQARLISTRAVGVILPLSGSYAAYGRQALAAVELGLGLFGRSAAQPPTLFIEDSRSDAASAAQAVSRLVEDHKVIAIIGPIGAATSLAAARQAQRLGVPLITITQVRGVTMAGDFVFQNFFTPAEQVAALLNEVMGNRGLKRAAILAPNNNYGKGFARRMASGLASRGGELVRTIYYDPQKTDFTAEIKSLVHLPLGNYRPGRPDSPKPNIDFQALFIPDGPNRAAMLAPQLAYFDVNGIVLMGVNLWHNSKLLEMGGRYLDGGIFPDAFDAASDDLRVSVFVNDFRQALGSDPNVLAAHAYDAAMVVRRILDGPDPPRTRSAFRQALAGLKSAPGVCGLLSMGPDRRMRKSLQLFMVRRGAFVPLNQAGESLPMPRPAEAEVSGASAPETPPPPPLPARTAPAATIPR